MREILFRGRNGNGWFIGFLHKSKYDNYYIYDENGRSQLLSEETIGQYTGLKDKNGTKIFEGDIVKCSGYFDNPQLVKWNNEWCAFEPLFDARPIEAFPILGETNRIEVIGNIYDNPELLETKND